MSDRKNAPPGAGLTEPIHLEQAKIDRVDRRLWKQNAALLESYLHKPIDEIERDYRSAIYGEDFERQKEIERSPSPERIRAYYETATTYLYELSAADSNKEQQREFRKVAAYCIKKRLLRIMDFGGGGGGFSVMMRRKGLAATYFDVVGHTSRFAEWKFERLGLDIPACYDFSRLRDGSFDAIHTADCLEHVPQLSDVFRQFARLLRMRGALIMKATFEGGGIHLRENEKYHDIHYLIKTLGHFGLTFSGQLKDDRISFNINKWLPNYFMFNVYVQNRKKLSGNYLIFNKTAS